MNQTGNPVVTASGPTLSRREAAAYLGLAVSTLENWASCKPRGFLPFTKVGGRVVRYFKSDLDAFLSRGLPQESQQKAA